ncbi:MULTISPECIES: hypothetical protein [Parabacteroides]|nr:MULTISPECIES: hypothetical protein [Parabacteroides]
MDFSPIAYRSQSKRNVAKAKKKTAYQNRQLKQTANKPVMAK